MIETLLNFDPITLSTFMAAAVILYLTPGADMMFTLASGIKGGSRAGIAAAIGISMGVLCHVLLAALGLAALLQLYPASFTAIRLAGAAYLLWLAYQAFTSVTGVEDQDGRTSFGRAFRQGFVTNILNPKVALFVLSFLPQFTAPEIGPIWQQIIWLGLFLAIGGVITDGAYGVFAGLMAQKLRAGAKVMNRISGLVFGGLAVAIVADFWRNA
ncbi:MAG: LysE family translocator [Pseudomonadota bacterium]